MSAKHRYGNGNNVFDFSKPAVANPHDWYPTPAWCTRSLLAVLDVKGKSVLEPCAGTGAIAEVLRAAGARVSCIEIDQQRADECGAECGDFLALPADPLREPALRFDLVITNPPFSLAMEFVERSMLWAPRVAMLLRLSWLASIKRAPFLRAHTPSLYVLPKRPSFTGKGTDSADYAWFLWKQYPGTDLTAVPTVAILEVVP